MRSLCGWKVPLGVTLVALCVAARLAPHPPNLSSVAAVALFAGAVFTRRAAATIAVAAMFLSDWAIGFYDARIMLCVYVALVLPVLLAHYTRGRCVALRVASCATIGSVVFFAVSNFGVWRFGGAYELTPAGLWECYVAAAPFFRYTLVGDLGWSALFFGAYALAGAPHGRAGFSSTRYRVLAPPG